MGSTPIISGGDAAGAWLESNPIQMVICRSCQQCCCAAPLLCICCCLLWGRGMKFSSLFPSEFCLPSLVSSLYPPPFVTVPSLPSHSLHPFLVASFSCFLLPLPLCSSHLPSPTSPPPSSPSCISTPCLSLTSRQPPSSPPCLASHPHSLTSRLHTTVLVCEAPLLG